jgi:hypothetical protein
MGINQNNQRHVVWQDVKRVKPVPLEPIKKPKRIRFKKPDFKKISKFFNKNNLKQIKNKFCSLPKKKKIVICILIIFVLALSAFIIKTQLIDRMTSSDGYSVENLSAKTPQFKAFLPKDKTIDDLGGWHWSKSRLFYFISC